jgi:hypothetical protein
MSLLSSTQGTPERVWSLIEVLAAHSGDLECDELLNWLQPKFQQRDENIPDQTSAADQTIDCARSLDVIRKNENRYELTFDATSIDFEGFADLTHNRMSSFSNDHADSLVFEAFAWLVIAVEREKEISSILRWNRGKFADEANQGLSPRGSANEARIFNTTKITAWERWIQFLGLGIGSPHTTAIYPYITARLERKLQNSSGLPIDEEIPVRDVLNQLTRQMPYIDGGEMFLRTREAMQVPMPDRGISRILSIALRDLHDDGVITLNASGDAKNLAQLSPDDNHATKSVGTIIINSIAVPND